MSASKTTYLILAIGIVAGSQSGNLIRLGDAPAVVIAAYRLSLAALLLLPLTRREPAALARLTRGELGLLVLAGVALALHLFAWIAAVQLTTVANAAIAFSVNPVLTAAASFLVFGERITPRLFWSILLGIGGVAAISWGDFDLDPRFLLGDGTAVLCAAFFTVYVLAGKKLRQKVPTATYACALYGIAAAFAFASMLFLKLPFSGYDQRTWLCFVSMAVVPTVIGHTALNHALKQIAAGRVAAATLSEPLLAGVVAYLAWDEPLSGSVAVGYLCIAASVYALISDRARDPNAAPKRA